MVPKGIAGMKDYVGGGPAGTAEWTGLDSELPSRAARTHSDTHRYSEDHLRETEPKAWHCQGRRPVDPTQSL